MEIVGFLQNRDNVENGMLARCLKSMSLVAGRICVYDDGSDEDVRSLYSAYDCTVVYGGRSSFSRELYHKEALLGVALRYQPDWLVWFDSDAVLGRVFESRDTTVGLLESAQEHGFVRLFLHNLNLWRSPWWYRKDLNYNDLWHCVWWRNTGQLHYQPRAGLHMRQYPFAFRDPRVDQQVEAQPTHFTEAKAKLLHFGFGNEVEIARKYFTYREQGQTGGRLDRLVSEGTMVNPYTGEQQSLTLEPVDREWYPEWLLPELGEAATEPKPPFFDPAQMAECATFDEWLEKYWNPHMQEVD